MRWKKKFKKSLILIDLSFIAEYKKVQMDLKAFSTRQSLPNRKQINRVVLNIKQSSYRQNR